MAVLRFCRQWLWISIFVAQTLAQSIAPSNSSTDLLPIATSPRFLLNGTEFGSNFPAIRLAPLKPYAQGITKGDFETINQSGQLVNVDASNVNSLQSDQFGYLSCDPSAYTGYLNASQVFNLVFNSGGAFIIILYSETANHCSLNDLSNPGLVNAVLTTVDPAVASMIAKLHLDQNSKGSCAIVPDLNSYTNVTNNGSWDGGSVLGPSPTTAVAMIILYSITGIITGLFVVIIVTGAIRAHRHPERYGARVIVGRGRQSRAKGIARAMLETLPIVKFGDHHDLPVVKPPTEGTDIEMNAADSRAAADPAATTKSSADDEGAAASTANDNSSTSNSVESSGALGHLHNPDGTQADGSLGCSICTEDFNKGEEVRVLPCNHKFHPECVDPWLLNVSGTCPLCRIDLRPKGEEAATEGAAEAGVDGVRSASADGTVLPPPLEGAAGPSSASAGRRETVTSLTGFASGTREERIAALRRLREDRRRRGISHVDGEVERRGLRERLRTRLNVRTMLGGRAERRGTNDDAARSASTS